MPALQSITIYDGETTPVAHVFTPRNIDAQGVARYKESTGVPIADRTLSISLRESPAKIKARFVLALPTVVEETINGVVVPKEVRGIFVDCNFSFDPTSNPQERENAKAMMASLLDEIMTVTPVLVNPENVY
jgi:hypothetical protein